MKRYLLHVVVVCVAMVGVGGCGDSGAEGDAVAQEIESLLIDGFTPIETTTTTIELPAFSESWLYEFQSGYAVSVDVSVWEPVQSPTVATIAHPGNQGFAIESGYDFDSQADCVIPVRVVLQNETPEWEVSPHLWLRLYRSDGTYSWQNPRIWLVDLVLNVGGGESYEYTCTGHPNGQFTCSSYETSGFGPYIGWESPLSPEDSRIVDGFIVLRDYMTPALPDGDAQLLDAIEVSAMPTLDPIPQSPAAVSGNDAPASVADGFLWVGSSLSGSPSTRTSGDF